MKHNSYIVLIVSFLFLSPASAQPSYSIPFDDHVIVRFENYTVYADVLTDKKDWRADPEKTYYWNIADTIQSTQGGYSGKLLDGSYKEVYPDKNLRSSGRFRLGLKTGKWHYWYPGGVLRKISIWRGGKENGRFELYNNDGTLMQSGRYNDGLLHGVIRTYSFSDSTIKPKVTLLKYRRGEKVPDWQGSVFGRLWNKIFHPNKKKE